MTADSFYHYSVLYYIYLPRGIGFSSNTCDVGEGGQVSCEARELDLKHNAAAMEAVSDGCELYR